LALAVAWTYIIVETKANSPDHEVPAM